MHRREVQASMRVKYGTPQMAEIAKTQRNITIQPSSHQGHRVSEFPMLNARKTSMAPQANNHCAREAGISPHFLHGDEFSQTCSICLVSTSGEKLANLCYFSTTGHLSRR